jgi:1-deoxy-D-xylulose-5-phosphate reductoisomerase
MRELVLLGSTGSIGTQAIDIVRRNPDRFRVVALGAGGGNVELLAAAGAGAGRRGRRGGPGLASCRTCSSRSTPRRQRRVRHRRLPHPEDRGRAGRDDRAGRVAVRRGAQRRGRQLGLAPTLAALASGRILALANKESLVAGGPLVQAGCQRRADRAGRLRALGARPVPARRRAAEVRRLVLTASGGAFRGGRARSWPTSRSRTRSSTRPGTWARSSRSTRPRWSTRGSR